MKGAKRDRLIKVAQGLFAREGFKGVSVDRLVKEAGVAKMTLYKGFGSKSDLIQETLRRRDEEFGNWLEEQLEVTGYDPESKLLRYFDAVEAWANTPNFNGCYFVSVLSEFGDPESSEARLAKAHKRQSLKYVESLCTDCGFDNAESVAQDIRLLVEGATVAKMTLGQVDSYQRAKQIAKVLIAGAKRRH